MRGRERAGAWMPQKVSGQASFSSGLGVYEITRPVEPRGQVSKRNYGGGDGESDYECSGHSVANTQCRDAGDTDREIRATFDRLKEATRAVVDPGVFF